MARGFYSLVQYCPDRFRAETVNIGLVVLSIEPQDVRVRLTDKFDRVRNLFAMDESSLTNLHVSAAGLKSRIENAPEEFRTEENLAAFAASRGNDIRLTPPRLAKLTDLDRDFERLFDQMVEYDSTPTVHENTSALRVS